MMEYGTAEGQTSATNVAQLLNDIRSEAIECLERHGEIDTETLTDSARAHENFIPSPTWCTRVIDNTTDAVGPTSAQDFRRETMEGTLERMAAVALVEKVLDDLRFDAHTDGEKEPVFV